MLVMKIRISYGIWNNVVFYIFAVLFTQMIEIFIPFSITKIFILYLLIISVVGILNSRIKVKQHIYFFVLCALSYILLYLTEFSAVFSYVYPFWIVLYISLIMLDNLESLEKEIQMKSLSKCSCIYIILNLLIYFSRYSDCFQDSGTVLQYKGALPHANMFACIMFGLCITEIWNKGKISWFNKIGASFLLCTTFSRTYVILMVIIWVIIVANVLWKRLKFGIKCVIGIVVLILFGGSLFDILVMYIPAFVRFKSLNFGGNGRNILNMAYIKAIEDSSIIDKIYGMPIARNYVNNISVDFNHSFAECTYVSIFLLFGVIGVIFFFYTVYRILQISRKGIAIPIFVVMLTSLFVQDTLLSVQTGIVFYFAILVFFRKTQIMKKMDRCVK